IANPWSVIDRQTALSIDATSVATASAQFTVPADVPRHGCFRVHSYPRFVAASPMGITGSKGLVSLTEPASNTRQINRDSRMLPCPLSASPSGTNTDSVASGNVLPTPNPQSLPRMETLSTSVVIGTAAGAQLYLYHRAFLPLGWSYTVSDTGWISP